MSQHAFGIANLDGRAHLVLDGHTVDLEAASDSKLPADPMAAVSHASAIATLAAGLTMAADAPVFDPTRALAPVPSPSQVFAIGLNYQDHASEAQLPLPKTPMVFTKFPSCLAGPCVDIPLSSDTVDFEVELVVVVGRAGRNIDEDDALAHVAGYCIGQDISNRRLQFSDKPPQFSLGKSEKNFGPIGPYWRPLRSFADPLDLQISCHVNGEEMQNSRTSQMIFSVPALLAYLSAHCELRAGDLIFTGTPAGIGAVRKPPRFLQPDDVIESAIEGLGKMRQRCVGAEKA